jgi:RecA/RadA recombinase
MSLLVTSNDTIKNAVEILESVGKNEQDKMLRLLKLEKARSIAKKLDKQKPKKKMTDQQITDAVHTIRKSYGGK